MEGWLDRFAAVAFSGKATRMEYQVEQIGRWYTAFVSPVGARRNLQLFRLQRHHRKKARRADAARAGREAVFLLRLSDVLRVELRPDTIGRVATRLFGEQLGVDRCYIVRLSRDVERSWAEFEYRRHDLLSVEGEYRAYRTFQIRCPGWEHSPCFIQTSRARPRFRTSTDAHYLRCGSARYS
ncbi:PAS/PAC domain protein [Candidatus Paraburkholderia calva]|nr:PAS/PAC domain protein [Candidatus Paraburkholderia calva]